jgi:AcrR family transcriptional regulator
MSVVTTERRSLRKKAEKRDRIRAAAYELFLSNGYEETTTKEIAIRAGVATGTVFLYAKDKPDLLFLVMRELLREAVEAGFAEVIRPAPLLDQLMTIFSSIFAMYEKHPEIARAFIRHLPGADGPNAQAVNAYTFAFLAQLAALIAEGQSRGDIAADIQPMLAASNIFCLYFGALMAWLGGFADLKSSLDPGLRRSLDLQLRGLLPR